MRVRAGAGVWLVDLSPWIELGITYAYILSQKQCRIKLSHNSNVSAVVSHKDAMLLVLGLTPTDVLFFGFSDKNAPTSFFFVLGHAVGSLLMLDQLTVGLRCCRIFPQAHHIY